MRARSFYFITLRANAKKKDFINLLEKSVCPGCFEVVILAACGDRAGFFVTEVVNET